MVNTLKLRAKIIEKGMTYEKISEMLGISSCTLGRKIRNISAMTLPEAEMIMNILSIPITEACDYFFGENE